MKDTALTLNPLWINHIERFSERMRPRLYGALIAFLLHGTPIPEKLMPYLGIILDLMEAENGVIREKAEDPDNPECLPSLIPAPPAEELEYLRTFTEECARRCCDDYKIDKETFASATRSIFDHWQRAELHGAPIRHKDENDFWEHMARAVHYEFKITRRAVSDQKLTPTPT
ncbi:MAG: hypothetical protein K2M19_01010 [Muribaculaceae bacterium]|nr:hypothetical protein [Muribaculaceae bacterium]